MTDLKILVCILTSWNRIKCKLHVIAFTVKQIHVLVYRHVNVYGVFCISDSCFVDFVPRTDYTADKNKLNVRACTLP